MSCRLKINTTPYYFEIPDFRGAADLVIGIPCFTRPVEPNWVNAIKNLYIPENLQTEFVGIQGENLVLDYQGDYAKIGPARDFIIKKAIAAQAKYLLFIDDDVEVPQNTIISLLSVLQKDPKIKVCGGLYAEKGPRSELPFDPGIPVVWDLDGDDIVWWPLEPFECGAIGAGCMMIDMTVFKQLKFPIFHPTPQGKNDDIFFCNKVRKLGYKVFADGEVDCGHWAGTKLYKTIRKN